MRTRISAPIILLLAVSTGYIISFTQAIGVANVEVTSVYWGSNPLEPSAAHPGDVNVQLSVVLSNVGDDVARKVNATLFLEPPLSYAFYSEEDEYSAASLSKFAGDIAPGSRVLHSSLR